MQFNKGVLHIVTVCLFIIGMSIGNSQVMISPVGTVGNNTVGTAELKDANVTDVKLEHGGYRSVTGGTAEETPVESKTIPARIGETIEFTSLAGEKSFWKSSGTTYEDWYNITTIVDNSTIEITTGDSRGEISVKDGGIDTDQLKDISVTDEKLEHGGYTSGNTDPYGTVIPSRYGQIYYYGSPGNEGIKIAAGSVLNNHSWYQLLTNVDTTTLSISDFSVISVKDGGIGTEQLIDTNVTDEKLEHGGFVTASGLNADANSEDILPSRIGEILYYTHTTTGTKSIWIAVGITDEDWVKLSN